MVEVSQNRGCWKAEEMKDIGITYNNVSEIVKQLQAEQTQAEQTQAEQTQQEETHGPIETIIEQVEDKYKALGRCFGCRYGLDRHPVAAIGAKSVDDNASVGNASGCG